jgi:hypothetical protein
LRAPCYEIKGAELKPLRSQCKRQQIDHCFGLFHGDLLNNVDVADPVTESIGDFNVLNVRDSIPGVVETFHVLPKAFIILLLDGLQSLCCRWTLVRAVEVTDEDGT